MDRRVPRNPNLGRRLLPRVVDVRRNRRGGPRVMGPVEGRTRRSHFCAFCKAAVLNVHSFCGICGGVQGTGLRCPQCRHAILATWVYCEQCGCMVRNDDAAQPDGAPMAV